jgi:uncharacterized protein (DUF1697 family)
MTYVALLRAVNLAGRNRVAMAELRDLLAGLGFTRVRTLLQSGNAVFDTATPGGERLERAIHDALAARLGLPADVLVRDAAEWAEVIARNPFPGEAARDPGHLLVYFLTTVPPVRASAVLQAAITGREIVRTCGRHAYIAYPDGIGRSRVTAAVVERHLGARATARNWNTVLKLAELTRA